MSAIQSPSIDSGSTTNCPSIASTTNYQSWGKATEDWYPNLDVLLQKLGEGDTCNVGLFNSTITEGADWFRCKGSAQFVKSHKSLLELLRQEQVGGPQNHCLDFVEEGSAETVRAIAYYRGVTPQFFNLEYSVLEMDSGTKDEAFFSIQFFGRYLPGYRPFEGSRLVGSPEFVCINPSSKRTNHWQVSRVGLFIRRRSNDTYYCLLYLDPVDRWLAAGIRTLLEGDPKYLPLCRSNHIMGIVSYTLYMIAVEQLEFIKVLQQHLQSLTLSDIAEIPSLEELLDNTRKLHELLDLWRECRRRVVAAQTIAQTIVSHPFILANGLQDAMEASLRKPKILFQFRVDMIDDMVQKTNVSISLIFNIATLHDTRAALEESRAANKFASSVQSISTLTFVYLPVALVATIFGMNVSVITGDQSQPSILVFIAFAAGLSLASFGTLFIWSYKVQIGNWARERRRKGVFMVNGVARPV